MQRSQSDRRAFREAAARARAERNAEGMSAARVTDSTRRLEPLSPMQRRILNNVDRLSELLKDVTTRAMKTDNLELQQDALRGIQQIGKQTASLKKRLEDKYVDKFTVFGPGGKI